tara:strand:+ start:370 stop:996 length:627 start_codon:yes stop_codon:yes gene_type:complete
MSNKSISAITPDTFINNSVESLNNVQSNILSSINDNVQKNVPVNIMPASGTESSNDMFFYFIIIFLLLAILGVNMFIVLGNVTDETIRNAGPFMRFIYNLFGYPVSEIIKTTVNVSGEGVKQGVEIATGTISSAIDTVNRIADAEDIYNIKRDVVSSTNEINRINKRGEKKYCYVGATNGVNTCATISGSDKCLSGHIFDDLQSCQNK